jgi:hypothetical protein
MDQLFDMTASYGMLVSHPEYFIKSCAFIVCVVAFIKVVPFLREIERRFDSERKYKKKTGAKVIFLKKLNYDEVVDIQEDFLRWSKNGYNGDIHIIFTHVSKKEDRYMMWIYFLANVFERWKRNTGKNVVGINAGSLDVFETILLHHCHVKYSTFWSSTFDITSSLPQHLQTIFDPADYSNIELIDLPEDLTKLIQNMLP